MRSNNTPFIRKSQICNICKSTRHQKFCIKDGLEYLQCKFCQHVYVQSQISKEELLDYYASRKSHHGSSEKEQWDYSLIKADLVYAPLLKKISRFTRMGNLLDIGCSNGSFVFAAQKMGWDAYGMELEKSSYSIAQKHGVRVYTEELEKQSFPDNYFSAITIWQVIEHVSDPQAMLKEIGRILKPGGILALSTPNIKSIAWYLLKKQWRVVEPQVHLHLFNCNGIKKLVEECGLKIKYAEAIDIKPSTLKDFTAKWKKKSRESVNSVARLANSQSDFKIKSLLYIRKALNFPLRFCGLGEDIYAYCIKPEE